MKKVFSLVLASSLIFGVSAIANAQPPNKATGAVKQDFTTSPEVTIESFLYYCSNDEPAFASNMVKGTNSSDPSLKILSKTDAFNFGNLQLRATQFKMKIDSKNPSSGTATYNLTVLNPATGFGITEKDQVTLNKRSFSDGYQTWVIVPKHLRTLDSTLSVRMITGNLADDYCGYTNYLAAMIAYPQEVLPDIYLGQSMNRLKQLGLAMIQFVQDHNERMDFDPQNFKEKLSPYLKDTSDFIAPGDSPEPVTFAVNSDIVGAKLADFSSPSQTVAFYLGHDQKLDFRYDGLSPVCFADGHVKAVSREEAKDLQWKP